MLRATNRFFVSVAPIAMFFASQPVNAQDAAPSPEPGAGAMASATATAAQTGDSLEEITVTANKVTSNLQTTPVAISVLGGNLLDTVNVVSPADLDRQVPGLTINNAGNFPANVTIHGVGYEGLQNDSSQPGVSLNENGVYLASPVALFTDFLDVGQIEVLRGPQGTVFGQNSDGGAINITTNAPELGKLTGGAEGSYGSYDYFRGRATLNVPVSESFAIRGTVQRLQHDGWSKAPNLPGHEDEGDQHSWTGRLNALWKPTDRLSINVWGEYFHDYITGLATKNSIDPETRPRRSSNDYYVPQHISSKIAAATIAYDFGGFTAKSITSYQKVVYRAPWSGDLLDTADAVAIYGVKDQLPINDRFPKTVTQEVDIASNPGGRFSWIAGAFYLRTKSNISVFEVQQSTPTAYTPNFDPTPAELGALYGAGLNFESVSNSIHRSVSIYGQGSYDITDRLKLTAGARYTRDRSTAETSTYYSDPVHLGTKFNKLTGKVALNYQATPENLVYASYSTGVKPGGTNLNPGSTVVPNAFKNELVKALEIGSKNELMDRKLRLNLSAFYNDYYNLQIPSEDPSPYLGGMTNLPKAHVYGLEGELSLLLPAGFRIDANAAALGSKVDSHFEALDPYVAHLIDRTVGIFTPADFAGRAAAFQDLKGNKLAQVPKFSSTVTLGNTSELPSFGTLSTTLQMTYRTAFEARIFNVPSIDRVPSAVLFNADARLKLANSGLYFELSIVNLTKKTVVTSKYAENFGVGYDLRGLQSAAAVHGADRL